MRTTGVGTCPCPGAFDPYGGKFCRMSDAVVKKWTRLLGTTNYDSAYSISTATDGSIYITGQTDRSLDGQTNSGNSDAFISKYIDTDYSNDPRNPTPINWSGTVTPYKVLISNSVGDSDKADYLTFKILPNQKLTGITLTSYKSTDGKAFIGLQRGAKVTASATNPQPLIGYTHFGSGQQGADVGANLITKIGGVLTAGTYSIWVQQLGPKTDYAFDLQLEDNSKPKGTPTLSGSFKAGQVITIDKTPIQDADNFTGYTPTYKYSWEVSTNGTTWTPLTTTDATDNNTTYTLTTTEVGKQIRGVVSYLDGYSTQESVATGGFSVASATEDPGKSSYTIKPSASTINEGAALTTTVATTNLKSGTKLYYSLGGIGINASDLSKGSLTGVGSVAANGRFSFVHTIKSDLNTEGDENLEIKLFSDASRTRQVGSTASVIIRDTSTAPALRNIGSLSVRAVKASGSTKDKLTGLSINFNGVGRLFSDNIYSFGGWQVEGEISKDYFVITRAQDTLEGRETRRAVYQGSFTFKNGNLASATVDKVWFFRVGHTSEGIELVGRLATPKNKKIANINNELSWSSLDSSSNEITYFASSNGKVVEGNIDTFTEFKNGRFFQEGWWLDPFAPNLI